jgi:uncharacterized protein with NAD-binding domain and iron-sulfur cluster
MVTTSDQTDAGVPPISSGRTKVAILGGGAGGLSAAFWLTSTPELRDRYEVTIYTRGWRLGGKGASGRDADEGQRIEEHGLHMWLGCYRYAFRTIRRCYEEWKPDAECPFKTWTDAFTAVRQVVLEQQDGPGNPPAWEPWVFPFLQIPGEPGDPVDASPQKLFVAIVDWLHTHLRNPPQSVPRQDQIAPLMDVRTIAFESDISLGKEGLLQRFVILEEAIHVITDVAEARLWNRFRILAKLGVAALKGFTHDILWASLSIGEQKAYDNLNSLDFRAWLKLWGADDETVDSAPVRAVYDLAFAYKGGDSDNPAAANIAAGVTLRLVLEMLTSYLDAPLFRMNAGMGDTIFTPLYQVLTSRGVRVCFFHRLRELTPAPNDNMIATIELDEQAELAVPTYQPFVRIKGLDCWPNEPAWNQLKDGDALRQKGVNFESSWDDTGARKVTLNFGEHFDLVVLAVPPMVIRSVAPQLAKRSDLWRAMLENSASVPTQAFQLWLRRTTKQLGWIIEPTVLTSFAEPYDTWADMSHLLAGEAWTGSAPLSLQYFCGPLKAPDPLPPDPIKAMNLLAEQNAQIWLQQYSSTLWPAAAPPGEPINPEIISSIYCRGNIDPSELYVQTPAGSVVHRLGPDKSGFANLFLAGDWTLTRFSGGCVESAIESGFLAASAMCGEPNAIAVPA